MKIKKSASALSRSMRIGIATITSTAMLGGVLVAVPAHPLLPTTAIAQAQEIPATASAYAFSDLLNLRLLDEKGLLASTTGLSVGEILSALEAEQSWKGVADNGQAATPSNLEIELLESLNLNLGSGLEIPLFSDAGDSLLKGNLGLLGAFANAPSQTNAVASVGVISDSGTLDLDSDGGNGGNATIDLTKLLGNTVDLTDVASAQLELGALSSYASKNGTEITREYQIADAKARIKSPLVEDVVSELQTVVGGLDSVLETLLDESGVLDGVLSNPLVSAALGLELTVDVPVNELVDAIIDGELKDNSGLVSIDLKTGEILVDLEMLHGGNLNGQPANTNLLTSAQITQITDTVTSLLTASPAENPNGLMARVQNILGAEGGALNDTEVSIALKPLSGVLASAEVKTTLAGLLNPNAQTTNDKATYEGAKSDYVYRDLGGLLGLPIAGNLVAGVVDVIVGLLGSLGGTLNDALFNTGSTVVSGLLSSLDPLLDEVLVSLNPVLEDVLGPLVAVTVNKQDEEAGLYRVSALEVDVLSGAVNLPIANSYVSALDVAAVDKPTIEAIADQNITLGDSIKDVTPVVAPEGVTVEVAGLPEGVKYENGVISGKPTKVGDSTVTVTVTNASGSVTETFEITVAAVAAADPTIADIADQNIDLGDAIAPINTVVTPEGAVVTASGLPAEVTITDGVISGTPTVAGTSNVTVTVTNSAGKTASTGFTIVVKDPNSTVDAPTIAPIEDAEGPEEEAIDPIEVVVTPEDANVEVDGLPDGVDYNPETGKIEGTPGKDTAGSYDVTVTATNEGGTSTKTFIFVVTKDGDDNGNGGDENGSSNGSSDFLQQCLDSPAAGVAGLLIALGTVGAIAGPALEPLMKSIGAELDRQMRGLINATGGAHQPEWVRNINRGLNDAANAIDHRMVSQALFATAALALISTPVLCGMDNSSSSSS
ncbi:choice-of-anchor G family protein [Corynebacterium crudilactis]|uniref:Uncharacterized protein n=1 Tax=Corynebacterium crudilactis TaxID=1652495 RepID=A0A172QWE6_9CORY|nr:choice-of-anchor G family protein [Corynebacterium crudilactis]ANE04958.1 hypothetical protein ccrud_12630 [Corynebacterium crudilactis]